MCSNALPRVCMNAESSRQLSWPSELTAAVPVAMARPEKVDCGIVQSTGMAMNVPAVASTSAVIMIHELLENRQPNG
jgi:hypothetical protein